MHPSIEAVSGRVSATEFQHVLCGTPNFDLGQSTLYNDRDRDRERGHRGGASHIYVRVRG